MKNNSHLTREGRIEEAIRKRKSDFILVLENLTEEQNIAAILRTAEAFGIGKVYIIYQEKKPQVNRGAAKGAAKWLELAYYTDTKECLSHLQEEGFTMIGALVDPKAEVLWDQEFKGKIGIVVGNEASGISEIAQKMVDKNIYLPMLGLTESLNVSVAAAIFLYEVLRQKER